MTQQANTASTREAEAAQASDIEQRTGHGGNLRDAGPGAEMPAAVPVDVIGSSGHIPRLEEIRPEGPAGRSASPGADADRLAGESEERR